VTSRFALVIANTEYQDASFAKLTAPGRDAEEFAHVLREPDLAAFDDVQVLLNEGEGKIRRSIARFFVGRKRDDLLLLYFSGHGLRNDQGQLFLAVNDTEISILEATSIRAEFLTSAMNNSRSQRQLLILDCCNSGAFAHGSKSVSAVGKSMGIAAAFEGSGFGRVVLTATDATQYAWEGDKVIGDTEKSVFTHFLIEGLKGDADRNGDGRIDVDELYDFAYEQVVRRTPKQTPGKWSYKQQGDIILRDNLTIRDVKPVSLPPELVELLSHPNPGVRELGIRDLVKLLEGVHLGLARAAQEKLSEVAASDDSLTLQRSAGDALSAHRLKLTENAPLEVSKKNVEQFEERSVQKKESPKPIGSKLEKQVFTSLIPVKAIPWRKVGGIAGVLAFVALFAWGGIGLWNGLTSNVPAELTLQSATVQTVMRTLQPAATQTSRPVKTNTPPSTTTTIPLVPTSEFGIGSTMTGEDGMNLLYVPAGEFKMGSEAGGSDERPVHTVFLDAFWIDQTEVTNAMYSKCVAVGVCQDLITKSSKTHVSYYRKAEFNNYPVIFVSWNLANKYCEWADRRLPSEAEWEKAARGDDGRIYPWGSADPNYSLLNYNGFFKDTTEVGQFPSGASPYGALDMEGNVREWVNDWYSDTYYAISPPSNPLGPVSGTYRVLRGTLWSIITETRGNEYISYIFNVSQDFSSYERFWDSPSTALNNIGFRCAMDASP